MFFIFCLTSGINFYHHEKGSELNIKRDISLILDQKSYELNQYSNSIVNLISVVQNYIISTIDEERILTDSDYKKKYMEKLSEQCINYSSFTDFIDALYFGLEVEKFGGGSGIFITENNEGEYIVNSPIDVTKYSPDDKENAGWYYIPLLKNSPVWLKAYKNAIYDSKIVTYSLPIYKDEKLLGVLGIDIKFENVKSIIDRQNIPSLCAILGLNYNLIYSNIEYDSQALAKDLQIIVYDSMEKYEKGNYYIIKWNNKIYYGDVKQLENGMYILAALSRKDLIRSRNSSYMELAIVFFIISIITVVSLFYAISHFVKPLKILKESTSRIARGEFDIEIPYHSRNEIGELADSIRKMSHQLYDYIQKQTERERKEKEAALTQNKNKSEFLASLYLSMHEIDLNSNTFAEIHCRKEIGEVIGQTVENASKVLHDVMLQTAQEVSHEVIMKFIDFDTLNERMKDRITISQEFWGSRGGWCRARFIEIDRNEDGTLHHVIWAVENISEEKKERDRLQSEAERSEAASQAKSAFLANMSHEIRTPINAVLGMNEMILRESKEKQILEYSANIKSAGSTLLSIINDILDFSKIEAGKMEIIPEKYDLSSVIFDLVTMVSERALEKSIDLNLDVDNKIPRFLYGDSVRIKQCILNLLTNAVKYTKKGHIDFIIHYKKINSKKISLQVIVKDTGIGIKKEDIKKLFSPFERIEENKNRNIEGTGLGMSIVNEILSLMDSQLKIQSEYQKGSEFSFEIVQEVIGWEKLGDLKKSFKTNFEQNLLYKENLYAPDAKVLFVDDTEMNLEVIKGLLKNTGMSIDTAISGYEALEKTRRKAYDILFIDHRMPGMDGIETLQEIQKQSDNLCKGKPSIALTANAISGAKKMYLDAGFTDYISKPVDPEKLEDIIRKYLPSNFMKETSTLSEEEIKAKEKELESERKEEDEFFEKLKQIDGIDADKALENCGKISLLKKAVTMYYDSIEEKAEELETLLNQGDIHLYGVKVHALKSTSRLIGALELSVQAEFLELCSNINDEAGIKEKHGQMIELYKSYKEKLSVLIKSEKKDNEGEVLSEEGFLDYLDRLQKAADKLDINEIDSIMAELKKFAISEKFVILYREIQKSVENVDFINLKNLIKEEREKNNGND